MSDLAAHVTHETRPSSGRDAWVITDGETVYIGQLCSLQDGLLNHWADGANDVFVGPLLGGDDNAGSAPGVITGDTDRVSTNQEPPPEGWVDTSGVTLMHLDSVADTPTQAKQGNLIYCGTSNTDDMTLNSSGRTNAIGWMVRRRSATDVDVRLFTPSEFLAAGQS